jgi:putative peptidoglycan lipid II flippase
LAQKNRVKKFLYFISDKKLTIGNAAIILAFTSLASNILGVAREMVLAGLFGVANNEAGIYQGAFRLPDLIFNLYHSGAFSSAFIPIFIAKISKNNDEKAWEYASNILNFLLIVALVGGLIVFVFAPQLLPLIMPGYFWSEASRNTDIFHTTVTITRLLTLSPILFTIGNIFGGILNSYKKFIYFSLAPLVYNLSIIAFAAILRNAITPVVYAPVIGVVVGALFYTLIHFLLSMHPDFVGDRFSI